MLQNVIYFDNNANQFAYITLSEVEGELCPINEGWGIPITMISDNRYDLITNDFINSIV